MRAHSVLACINSLRVTIIAVKRTVYTSGRGIAVIIGAGVIILTGEGGKNTTSVNIRIRGASVAVIARMDTSAANTSI
jgi:hypothetical protein